MPADYLVSFPGLSLYDLPVNRIAFRAFGLSVYWYGLLIAVSILVCLVLAYREAPKFALKGDDILDVFIFLIPMIIVFARIYYVIFEWPYYAEDWRRIIDINHGGLAFYGGVIGGALAIILVSKVKKIRILPMVDFLAVYVPLGQAIGRWGNFFNQEAFGTNTKLPWGMYSNQTAAYLRGLGAGHDPSMPVHPTFLYEFIGNLIIFAILYRIRKNNKIPSRITLYYLLLYGLLRFFVERIRTDPLYIPGTSLRISLLVSAAMVIVSLVILIVLQKRQQNLELARALQADGSELASDDISLTEEESDQALPDLEEEPDFIPFDEIDRKKPDRQAEPETAAEPASAAEPETAAESKSETGPDD